MARRIITASETEEDIKIEYSLRPQKLKEYIGQEKAKANLKIYIEAADRKPWITCCFTVLLALEKRPWQVLSPMRWACI